MHNKNKHGQVRWNSSRLSSATGKFLAKDFAFNKVDIEIIRKNTENMKSDLIEIKNNHFPNLGVLTSNIRINTNYFKEAMESLQENLITDTLHDRFINHILEELVTEYNIPERQALKHIKESVFTELLEEDPDFVFHHDSSFWANAIFKEKYLTHSVMN